MILKLEPQTLANEFSQLGIHPASEAIFLHKSENTLERDSDIIRIYVGICNKVVSLLLHFVLTFFIVY